MDDFKEAVKLSIEKVVRHICGFLGWQLLDQNILVHQTFVKSVGDWGLVSHCLHDTQVRVSAQCVAGNREHVVRRALRCVF